MMKMLAALVAFASIAGCANRSGGTYGASGSNSSGADESIGEDLIMLYDDSGVTRNYTPKVVESNGSVRVDETMPLVVDKKEVSNTEDFMRVKVSLRNRTDRYVSGQYGFTFSDAAGRPVPSIGTNSRAVKVEGLGEVYIDSLRDFAVEPFGTYEVDDSCITKGASGARLVIRLK